MGSPEINHLITTSAAAAASASVAGNGDSGWYSFLQQYRVEKGADFTHTSFQSPTGAFYVPGDQMDAFWQRYKRALSHGEDLHVTEKHRVIGPVVVDLDFRAQSHQQQPRRLYSAEHVESFARLYCSILARYVDMDTFDVYVLEKPAPQIIAAAHSSTTTDAAAIITLKDGLHFEIPGVVTRPSVQHLVRADVLRAGLHCAFGDVPLTNKYEDVFDESIIERNNWLMYGSKKPGGAPYRVTRVLRISVQTTPNNTPNTTPNTTNNSNNNTTSIDDITATALQGVTDADLVELLSIRNKFGEAESPLRADKIDAVRDFEARVEERRRRKELMQTVLTNTPLTVTNVCDNVDVIRRLVDILDPRRADAYNEWVRLGWCLRNIDHRLLDVWDSFSRRSEKYAEGECARLWAHMKLGGLGVGTLHMWARTDSPGRYREVIRRDLTDLIDKSVSGTEYDIARVVHHMYRYDYVCASVRNRTWYEFRDHRWHQSDSAYTLRRHLSTDVHEEYFQRAMFWNKNIQECRTQKDIKESMGGRLQDIALKLKCTNFKDNLIKECCSLFYLEKFEEMLDSKCGLIGFLNGVYDLDNHEFREGRPDDYISYTTGINYVPYSDDLEHMANIRTFWAQVLPITRVREYVLTLLASFLSGHTRQERFHIWTGSGCHAAGTGILRADGSVVPVEHVAPGDLLVGDDGTPRRVLCLFRGRDEAAMWRVSPRAVRSLHPTDDSFVVNSAHVLSLRATPDAVSARAFPPLPGMCVIRALSRETNDGATNDSVVGTAVSRTLRVKRWLFPDQASGQAFAATALWQDPRIVRPADVVDICVMEYLCLLDEDADFVQGALHLFRPDLPAQFTSPAAADDEGGESAPAKDTFFLSEEAYNQGALVGLRGSCTGQRLTPYFAAPVGIRTAFLCGVLNSSNVDALDLPGYVSVELSTQEMACDIVRIARSLGHDATATFRSVVLSKSPRGSSSAFTMTQLPGADYYGFQLSGNGRYLLADFTVTHNSNGKSVSVELFDKALGDYSCKFPVTLLTQKRAASNSATSEVARAKGRRFACLQEPSEDERLNIGLLKELTGGDKVQARAIYKEPVEFKPQWHIVLCCNHLPNVPSDDGGTWRRIRVVNFTSKFTERPAGPNEFPVDTELSQKLDAWKEPFMSLLIEYHRTRYRNLSIEEPDEVLACTREYQKENDHYADFVDSCITKDPAAALSLQEAFTTFKAWLKGENISVKVPKKKALQKYLDGALGKGESRNGGLHYVAYCLRQDVDSAAWSAE